MAKIIGIDYETYYDTGYSVRDMTVDRYVRDPQFNPYLIAVCDGSETWAGAPKDFNFDALEGATLVAYNAPFDRAVHEEAVRRGMFPKVDIAGWKCAMQGMSYLWRPSPALKDSMLRFFGITRSKEVRAQAKGKLTDYSPQMLEYAGFDAADVYRLWTEKVAPYWPAQEQRLAELTERQGNRGIRVDVELLEQYIETLERAVHANQGVLPWYPQRKPTSPKGLAEACREAGIPCPPSKTDDEEGYQDWEDAYRVQYPWVLAVGYQRSLTKLLAKFKRIHDSLRDDGTFAFQLRYWGAHTGRWSGDKVNMQSMRRSPLLLDLDMMVVADEREVAALTHKAKTGAWPDYISAAIDERCLWIAREGHKLVIADLSQIEPRVLNWLVDNRDLLDRLRKDPTESVYEAFARGVMGYSKPGSLKKNDPKLYSLYKAMVLGLGYGCGADKFLSVADAMAGLKLTLEESQEAVDAFRGANPLICGDYGYWRKLDNAVRGCVGKPDGFSIDLPSGRTLRYEELRRSPRPPKLDPETGEIRSQGWQTTAIVGRVRTSVYGGKLCENVVQAVARDVFAHAMLRTHDEVAPVLFTAHDELIAETPEQDAEAALEATLEIMRQVPAWAEGLPTNAEGLTSPVYVK